MIASIRRGLKSALNDFEPRSLAVACARSLLATSQLTIFLFNPDTTLFARTTQVPTGVRCDGLPALSLWCVVGTSLNAHMAARIVAMIVLAAVVIGIRPRWTCIPHWYVAFSLAVSLTLPNGGETVSQVMTMLLVPMCLGDRRAWQWHVPKRGLDPGWRGAAYASLVMTRVQASIIYLTAAVSKLMVAQWRDGTALDVIAYHPYHGFPEFLRTAVDPAVSWLPVSELMTWATIGAELLIGLFVLGNPRTRSWALTLGLGLHLGIIVLMGLPTFGTIMIALLILVRGDNRRRQLRIQAKMYLGDVQGVTASDSLKRSA